MSSLTKRVLVQCWCIFTLTYSTRCHSRTYSQVRTKTDLKNSRKTETRVSSFRAPDCPVHPLLVGPAWPGEGLSPCAETRERSVRKLNFSGTPDSAPDCPVCHLPNGYLSELAVGNDRWRTGLSGAPMRRKVLVTTSWWVRAIYTPYTHHIDCLAAHIYSYTLVEHYKHHKAY